MPGVEDTEAEPPPCTWLPDVVVGMARADVVLGPQDTCRLVLGFWSAGAVPTASFLEPTSGPRGRGAACEGGAHLHSVQVILMKGTLPDGVTAQ